MRSIFREADDLLLNYEYYECQKLQPTFYVPIIPMILVNGSDGIITDTTVGTTWISNVPCYNPIEIIGNLLRMLDGEDLKPMVILVPCNDVFFIFLYFSTHTIFGAVHQFLHKTRFQSRKSLEGSHTSIPNFIRFIISAECNKVLSARPLRIAPEMRVCNLYVCLAFARILPLKKHSKIVSTILYRLIL